MKSYFTANAKHCPSEIKCIKEDVAELYAGITDLNDPATDAPPIQNLNFEVATIKTAVQ